MPERRKSGGQAECPRGRTASLARPLAARGREEEIAEARAGPGVFHPLQRAVATGTGHGTPEGLALAFAEVCCGAMSHHRPGQTLRRTASPLHLPLASVACVVVVAPSPGARIAGSVHSLRSAAVRGHGAWSVRQKVLFQLTAV